jgi:hypothetical protein
MKTEIRWCDDIGMFALDRPIPTSCVHRTEFCDRTCFNVKLYKFYKDMSVKDVRNEEYWQQLTGAAMRATFKRKRKQTDRARFMTRGEALKDHNDVNRVENIVLETPGTDWWLPTRAWRNALLLAQITSRLVPIPNLHVLASMDPSNSPEDWEQTRAVGLSTMYYGDDTYLTTPLGEEMFKCPKTWGHVKGACGVCKRGCFEGHGRVDVHLQAH